MVNDAFREPQYTALPLPSYDLICLNFNYSGFAPTNMETWTEGSKFTDGNQYLLYKRGPEDCQKVAG